MFYNLNFNFDHKVTLTLIYFQNFSSKNMYIHSINLNMYQDNLLLENSFNVTDLFEDLVKHKQVKKMCPNNDSNS